MSNSDRQPPPPKLFSLGPLESEVLSAVCESGSGSVDEIRGRLSRPFAYTTVMTTLDRLFKKELLQRSKSGRRFLYSPRALQLIEDRNREPAAVAPRWNALTLSTFASYLLDAVGTYDETLLQELERTIANRRQQFEKAENE